MMSLQTLRGAASVLEADSSPEDLVQKIASKGGTTEAALTVFRQQGFGRMVDSAIEAACERSRELGRK
jgi:pyrroline-5-carboxylate reductase